MSAGSHFYDRYAQTPDITVRTILWTELRKMTKTQSLPFVAFCVSILSGAMYGLQPTFVFARELIRLPAMPKSHSLISIFFVSVQRKSIFEGFTSR